MVKYYHFSISVRQLTPWMDFHSSSMILASEEAHLLRLECLLYVYMYAFSHTI